LLTFAQGIYLQSQQVNGGDETESKLIAACVCVMAKSLS
jgi:hypothetical protein